VRNPWKLLPKSGWKRWLALIGITIGGFVLLVVTLVVSVMLAWQNPNFQAWVFTQFVDRMSPAFKEESDKAPAPLPSYHGFEPDARALNDTAGLFQTTNVWKVHLAFSEDQWKALGPQRIAPMPGFMQADGRPLLRNTNAMRSGLAGVLGFNFPWSTAAVEFGGVSFTNVGVRIKGNGTFLASLGSYKHPFKVELNHYVKGQRLAGKGTLNFGNLNADFSCLGDALGYEFFRDAGVPAPRTAFARMLLSITGREDHRPLGLYVMAENPDDVWARDRFGQKGTAIFKPVTYELFSDLGTNWSAYSGIYDPKTKITTDQEERLMALARFVAKAPDAAFAAELGNHLDVEEVARYFACETLLSNYDGIYTTGQNFLMYLDPRTQRFGLIPWDLDHSWGEFPFLGTVDQREHASIWHPWVGKNHFLERLFSAPVFKEAYRRELEHLVTTVFVPARLSRRVDELAPVVRPVIAEVSTNRLARFDVAVSSKFYDGPRDARSPDDPNRPVWQLKRFFANRAASVRDQLDGKSEGLRVERNARR
jgi:hypothetical protein